MRQRQAEPPETVPYDLAVLQIDAYRYAFMEAVKRANEAIKQRDYYRSIARESTCKLMSATGGCAAVICDETIPICPEVLGIPCGILNEKVDKGACYL